MINKIESVFISKLWLMVEVICFTVNYFLLLNNHSIVSFIGCLCWLFCLWGALELKKQQKTIDPHMEFIRKIIAGAIFQDAKGDWYEIH